MRTSRLNARVLLTCGAIGPPLYVVVFLIEGATRPDYRPLRHPVSSLSLGAAGWVQSANFLITGVLVLAFALGLRPALRRYGGGIWVPLLIGLVGIGLVGAGLFPADPMSGYPAGTPMVPVRTTRGVLHDAFSTPVFTALPAACFVIAYRFAKVGRREWAGYSVVTAVVFLICFVLAGIGFSQHPTFMPIGGLLQRVTLIVGLAWLTALALHLLRQGGRDRRARELRSAQPAVDEAPSAPRRAGVGRRGTSLVTSLNNPDTAQKPPKWPLSWDFTGGDTGSNQ